MATILEIAEINEAGVDEMDRHIFTDDNLAEFVKNILVAHKAAALENPAAN